MEASQKALERAGITAADLDLIIVSTDTPDYLSPSTSIVVQNKLGADKAGCYDINSACAGWVTALDQGAKYLMTEPQMKYILVAGGYGMSRFLDFKDKKTANLFADGAGAVVLSAEPAPTAAAPRGILATYLSADGRLAPHLYADGGPASTGTVGLVRMNGKEVFRNAVEQISNAVFEVTERAKVARSEIDWFVPHQANIRIIESCAKRLELDMDRVIVSIDKHANTSSASIPLALDAGIRDGRIKRGQLLVFAALGGGLAWGSALVRF